MNARCNGGRKGSEIHYVDNVDDAKSTSGSIHNYHHLLAEWFITSDESHCLFLDPQKRILPLTLEMATVLLIVNQFRSRLWE
jgi:hypothetical protein